jgi:outer membrane protein assembly factor BamB
MAWSAPGLPAADWPRFRGPNGTGLVDADLPIRWGPEDIVWKTALPGVGHSSPIVGGGRIFVQSAAADGQARWLLCVNSTDGKVLWQREAPGRPAHTHPRNSLASSTPALDGERVYAVFWDGKAILLAAYTYKGEPVWHRDLGSFKSQHGPGFSPIVVDGRVILSNDQDGSAVLLAFDAHTGKPLWQAARKAFRACYSTPFVRQSAEGAELVVVSTAAVSGYDPATGTENWYCTWPTARMPLRTVSSPILVDGVIIATAGDGAGDRLAMAVRPGGTGNMTETNRLWQDRKSLPYVPSVLGWGPYIYSVNDTGFAACHRAATGEVVWQERLGGPITASPILAQGKVYACTEAGDVIVFEAAPAFKVLGRNRLSEAIAATPAAVDGRLYVRGHDHLYCIAKPAGRRAAR